MTSNHTTHTSVAVEDLLSKHLLRVAVQRPLEVGCGSMTRGSWRGWPSWRAGSEGEAALPGGQRAAAAVAGGEAGGSCSQWT